MSLVIVHSHQLNEHGEPGPEYKARLDEGAELLINDKVQQILLGGGPATPGSEKFWSQAGMDYLMSNGIGSDKLIRETMGSRETVGELVFARLEHDNDVLSSDNQIILLSSDYHLRRLKAIGDLILGQRVLPTDYIGVHGFYRSLADEERSLQAFRNTFAGVPVGNLDRIVETLWKKHGLYKNHPLNPYL